MVLCAGHVKNIIMDTILVLTDFSDAAFHAACYAAGLTLQLRSKQLVLYHAYQAESPVSGPISSSEQTTDGRHAESMEKLAALHRSLEKFLNNVTTVRCRAEGIRLDTSINDVADTENANIIVMGIIGESALE